MGTIYEDVDGDGSQNPYAGDLGLAGWTVELYREGDSREKRAVLRALPGDKLTANISMFGNFNWPAVQYIGFANNHSVHHRGQLAAYLRPMGSRVPNIYGPSADDKEG